MAGASLSLVDFLQDAIATVVDKKTAEDSVASFRTNRLIAAGIALVPPLVVAYSFPNAFLGALENAGLIGGVSLYGVLPSLAVLRLMETNKQSSMPGKLAGSPFSLYALLLLSFALILPDVLELTGLVTG
jgi:amino acid permease